VKRLVVIAGPNGSGKSSLYSEVANRSQFPDLFICPDDLANTEPYVAIPDIVDRYRKAMTDCERLRNTAIAEGLSLAFETVMSTASKIDYIRYAQSHGYFIELLFICTADPAINIARITQRVHSGGHDVPSEKVIARYFRCLELLPVAITLADDAKVYDNSGSHPILGFAKRCNQPPILVNREIRPAWIESAIVNPLLETGILLSKPEDISVADTAKLFK